MPNNPKISDLLRPYYHFLPPKNWMNDPNGPVFYKGEYHLFFQYNPYADHWDNIHWGHAKSKDLVYWKHLPIALYPSVEKGENHCYSGDCVISGDVPTIIYTSIQSPSKQIEESEQWLATSNDEMDNWEKYTNNPIIEKNIHCDLKVKDWRDPFLWRENNHWYAVIGGHLDNPIRPSIFLYKSQDLYNWEFLNPLCIVKKSYGSNWECPNFFKLNDKYVLIVSNHRNVIYSVGDYINHKFNPGKWYKLDHGKKFYATNILKEDNRILLWAWIKAKGKTGWNGCLTLPRMLKMGNDNRLRFEPISELKKLRDSNTNFRNIKVKNENLVLLDKSSGCLEIILDITNVDAESFGFALKSTGEISKSVTIGYNALLKQFWAGKDFFEINENEFNIHIFRDNSIVEIFINYKECLTTQIIPNKTFSGLSFFSENGSVNLNNMEIWTLKPIW